MLRGRPRASSSCSNASNHDKGSSTQPLEWSVSRLGRPYREPVFGVGVSSMIAMPFECTGRLGIREREKRRNGCLLRARPHHHLRGPLNAFRRTPQPWGRRSNCPRVMIPAPVRSVPNNPNRRCIWLPNIMHPGWDTSTPDTPGTGGPFRTTQTGRIKSVSPRRALP